MNTTPGTTYAYVALGFFRAIEGSDRKVYLLDVQGMSELDLVTELCNAADLVEERWKEIAAANSDWQGVWDYEVSEELGRLIASHTALNSELPNAEIIKQMLVKLAPL